VKRWRGLHVLLRVLVSGGLLAYLVWRADPATIWSHWRAVDLRLFGLALLLQFLGVALSAAKWGLLLRAQGQGQPYRWLLSTYLAGQFASNFLPTTIGGDALRTAQLGRRIASYSQAGASIFVERLTGFLALSLIASLALATSAAPNTGVERLTGPALLLLTAGICLAAVATLALAPAAPRLQAAWGERLLPEAANRPLRRIAQALAAYAPRGRLLALVVGMSLLYQTLLVITHMVCGIALGLPAPFRLYAVMVPVTDILGLVPIFVNGLGARDLVFTRYLGQIGVAPASAIALSFLAFTVRLAISVIGGLIMVRGAVAWPAPEEATTSDKPTIQ
jgi:uncharacterized protein (TIRG00374 family)